MQEEKIHPSDSTAVRLSATKRSREEASPGHTEKGSSNNC